MSDAASGSAKPVPLDPAPVESDDDDHNPIEVLLEMLERFETDHPDLVKAINDVSHYLSGMGI